MSNCWLPLVVVLKTMALVMAVAIMTAMTRSIWARGSVAALVVRLAGGSLSCGATMANATPAAMEKRPGTTKAMRQPKYFTSRPVTTADSAMPRLPIRPLKPMVRPGFFECCTSMGMPTG